MNQPFFSIVIPTKNRPELLRDTISSVLLQNFDDYELIISDNFNDGRTKNVIDEFMDNPHINYIRTESELNIPDHWEFATKKTKGVYTLILTDRAFLGQGALQDIHNIIIGSGKNASVFFWNYGYFNEKSKILWGEKKEAGMKILRSPNLVRDFSRTLNARFLPRPHVGCYRFDIAQKIRQNIGRLYLPFGPDYTSSLLFLAYSNIAIYIPRPLVFFQGAAVSSGTRAQIDVLPYLSLLNTPNLYQFVPIKAPIISSLIFNDLLTIRSLTGGNVKDIDINWVFYFGICYEELMEKKMISGMDKKFLAELFSEWKRTLAHSDEKLQVAVRREIKRRYVNILKSYLRESFLGNFLVGIKRFFLRKPTFKFPNALAAGGFSDIDFNKQFSFELADYLKGIDLSNWFRYYNILKEAVALSPRNILEIGAGNEVVKNCLKDFIEDYRVMDVNQKLNPDILSDLREIKPELRESFDSIICADVLEHMPFEDLEKNFRNIHEYLKKGGRAIITIPHRRARIMLISPLSYQRAKIIELPSWIKSSPKSFFKQVVRRKIWIDPYHCWEIGDGKVKKNEVEEIIKKVGFKIEKFNKLLHVDFWVLSRK